jgi:hypothetical protein
VPSLPQPSRPLPGWRELGQLRLGLLMLGLFWLIPRWQCPLVLVDRVCLYRMQLITAERARSLAATAAAAPMLQLATP